jgi:hypothetical protein
MTTTSTRSMHLGRLQSRFLLSLVALAALLAVAAPAASAAYGIEAGSAFVKAHAPVSPKICSIEEEPPAPDCEIFAYFEGESQGQGVYWFPGYEIMVSKLAAVPELTQAGGHPDFTTAFEIGETEIGPGGQTKDIFTDLPAGSVAFPQAVPRCESADLNLTILGRCPTEAQVGIASTETGIDFFSPVNSMVPIPGEQAALGYKVFGFTVNLFARARSENDYGLTVEARELPTSVPVSGTALTLWGVPYDPIHDRLRFDTDGTHGGSPVGAHVTGVAIRPFTSAPTNCDTGPLTTTLNIRSWGDPENWISEDTVASEQTGCDEVDFAPQVTATPTTNSSDSPTGLNVDVHVPQNTECDPGPPIDCGKPVSHLKGTTIALPEGMTLNPSSANGLDGCSPAEIGLTTPLGSKPINFTAEPANCPDASKIGTAEVETPLLEAPASGSVYLADPYDNPLQSFLAIYIGVDDKERGLVAKFIGQVVADPVTGQLTTTFDEQPQLPIEHIRLNLKQGPHAPLRTPSTCGSHTTVSSLTPYSAPDTSVVFEDDFTLDSPPPGGACNPPHSPSMDAGAVTPIAGQFTPFVAHLNRADGTQEFRSVTLKPPAGLTAKLAGTPYCPDEALAVAAGKDGKAEQSSPSCPAASDVGDVSVGAGAGPAPYHTGGNVYLAGPYKGAPLSLAIVTPATAGPFDLGTVVVRIALNVDPVTAKITAVSDEIPRILRGIPLDIRSVAIQLDRSQFTKNPTSCDPTSVDGSLVSTLNVTAALSERFQLAECRRLGFAPKLRLRLDGKRFTRTANPRLTAVLLPREGDANIASTSVLMPASLLLDQSHIRTVCTRVQFASDSCPEGSIYGTAVATTPLLDEPLSGNVYLRSSANPLPDLVADLNGQVSVEVSGRTDSVKGALRNTFDVVPDTPVTRFELRLQGGPTSLLEANSNLCKGVQRAAVTMVGHNGRRAVVKQRINIPRCKGKRGGSPR